MMNVFKSPNHASEDLRKWKMFCYPQGLNERLHHTEREEGSRPGLQETGGEHETKRAQTRMGDSGQVLRGLVSAPHVPPG